MLWNEQSRGEELWGERSGGGYGGDRRERKYEYEVTIPYIYIPLPSTSLNRDCKQSKSPYTLISYLVHIYVESPSQTLPTNPSIYTSTLPLTLSPPSPNAPPPRRKKKRIFF